MDAKIQEYLPWIIGGGAVLGGIILFSRGVGTTEGVSYTSIPPQDVSALQQASIQLQQSQILAKTEGFGKIVDVITTKYAAQYELASQRLASQRDLAIAQAERDTQLANISAQTSIAKSNNRTALFTSILGTIGTIALLSCYEATKLGQENREYYLHGAVA